jgi:hypothetical protein
MKNLFTDMDNRILTEGNQGNEVMKNGHTGVNRKSNMVNPPILWKLIPFVFFVCFCLNSPAHGPNY